MGRGRSPARGHGATIRQATEVDTVAKDALEAAIQAWNAKARFQQIVIDRDSCKWLSNGNVEITLTLDTLRDDIDLIDFNEFMISQLGSPCSVRMIGNNLIFVSENEAILQAIPKHRYRFRNKLAAWIESVYEVIFALGLFCLFLFFLFLLRSVSPDFYKSLLTVLWDFLKSLLKFLWDVIVHLFSALGVAIGLSEPDCP